MYVCLFDDAAIGWMMFWLGIHVPECILLYYIANSAGKNACMSGVLAYYYVLNCCLLMLPFDD